MYKKAAIALISVLFLITLFFGYQAQFLKFNYVFEDFFPVDDPELSYYQEFTQKFENDNDYLLLGIAQNKSIFNLPFLIQLDSTVGRLNQLTATKEVVALTTLKLPIISPAGLYQVPFVHLDEHRLAQDSARLFRQKDLVGNLISATAKSTIIVLKHHPITNKDSTDAFVEGVKSILDAGKFDTYHIAGKTYAQGIFIGKIQQELMIFLTASVLLVIIFLAVAYRNWWGVLVPLAIVSVSAIWIMGIMAATNKSLDILMVLLPTIMFVVGMSDVVHLMTKYIENLRRGYTKAKSIKVAVREVGLATFLTSLTTSIGFLTLLTASIQPIKEFGIYTALGVFIAFIVAFTLLPACMILFPAPSISAHLEHRDAWFKVLSKSFLWVMKKRVLMVVSSVVITIISLVGISQIVINTYLIEDLPKDDPLKLSFDFFDNQFGGSRPFEVAVEIVDSNKTIFDKEVAVEIEKVTQYLKKQHEVGGLASPNSVIKMINQGLNGGNSTAHQLPSNDNGWQRIKSPLNKLIKRGEFEGQLITDDLRTGRITGWIDDIGSKVSLERNDDFKRYINENINKNMLNFHLTGTSNLIDKNNAYLANNMMQGLAIAFGVVALIAGLLFRSLRMVIITLIPNVIPLLIVAAIMGFFGITLKLSTSIVFTIAFGIAVDDTIHFTSKLKLELSKGKTLLYALKRTYLSTGKAIIVTSLILSGGFLILILSSFGGTFYTGLLISLTLLFALVIDLTLLPALILLFYPKNKLANKL